MSHAQTLCQGDRRNARLGEVFFERHPAIVQPPHNRCKPICANSAVETMDLMCERKLMTRTHPRRPHLKAWRLALGKSQEWLATELGTNHSTVQRQETGQLGVSEETFAAIAKAYGITIAELSMPPAEREKAREMDRLFKLIHALDADQLAALSNLAAHLKK